MSLRPTDVRVYTINTNISDSSLWKMSNSDAIPYTLILWIVNVLSKIWFYHIDLNLFS